MKCPLSLTLEAREKMRGHGKGRDREVVKWETDIRRRRETLLT
jgi:hypothetical protein